MTPDFGGAVVAARPFPHFLAPEALDATLAGEVLRWLRDDAAWDLRIEDFYEQHEIGLLDVALPERIACIVSPGFLSSVEAALAELLPAEAALRLVDVSAHRLTSGQTIRIHNDDLGGAETHRLLVQLNDGWRADQGGLLMLFSADRPESLADVVLPTHRSAFGFRISERSHHAVSTIHRGERFTLVYTFRQAA